MDELTRERFGLNPVAEAYRPLIRDMGDGRPDTPKAIAERRRVLLEALDGRVGRRRE